MNWDTGLLLLLDMSPEVGTREKPDRLCSVEEQYRRQWLCAPKEQEQ